MKFSKSIKLIRFVEFSVVMVSVAFTAAAAKKPQSITLKQAMEMAVKSSRQLAEARERALSSDAAVSTAWSEFFPKISATVSAGTFHDRERIMGQEDIPKVARDRNEYKGEAELRQPLFNGFGDVDQLAKAASVKKSREFELRAAVGAVTFQVLETYFVIELKQLELEAEEEVLALQNKQLMDIKNRLRQGSATELEVLQAEYAIRSHESVILDLHARIERLTLQFARITGMDLDSRFTLSSRLEDAETALNQAKLPNISESYQILLNENPGFTAQQAKYEALKHELSNTASQHLPSLDFVLTAGTNTHLRSEVGTPDTVYYGGKLEFTIPLFSGLSSFSQSAERRHELNATLETISHEREALLEELTVAFKDFEVSTKKARAEKLNKELSERTVTKAEHLYRAGRATLTDLLDSYSQRVEASRNLAKARFDKVMAFANIQRLLGRSPL